MSDLQIYVPSRSRFERSLTLEHLAPNWNPSQIYLVVPSEQRSDYKALAKQHGVRILPCPEKGIARTRHFIGEHADDKFVMFDDDLRFSFRPPFNKETGADQSAKNTPGIRLYPARRKQITRMLQNIEFYLDRYAHVGVSPRAGNQSMDLPIRECSRPLRVLAYRRREFLMCEHGRVAIMEDFDITLQLLTRGYKNALITTHVNDQAATNLPGGCSDYRSVELHDRNVLKMHRLWPEFTKVVMKKNKSGGAIANGLAERRELNIQWQKAWKSSGKDRKPRPPEAD